MIRGAVRFSFVVLLLLIGCTTTPPHRIRGVAMGIGYVVQLEKTDIDLDPLIQTTFAQINAIYNNWNPESEISKLNRLPAHTQVALSDELFGFLERIDHLVKLTEGRFDPTVGALKRLWKESLDRGELPSPQEHRCLQQAIGWEKVHFENTLFSKDNALTELDFGAVAKGFAVDLLYERLCSLGIENFYVEWGGEIRVRGKNPSGRPWRVAIVGARPISLREQALATSGSYLQFWWVGGKRYTHLIDPIDKLPLIEAPIQSASVIASSCMEADAIATAMMLFSSKEAGEVWAREHKIQVHLIEEI